MQQEHGHQAASRRPDAGFSIIEVIITISLMTIVMLPIMNAVTTAIAQSSRSRASAQVETTIVNAADRVNRAPKVCDYTVYVQAAVRAQGWDPSTVSLVHEHYIPPAQPNQAGQWVPEACEIDTPTDLLVQRVTIRITSPDANVSRSIQVVKSDV